MIAAPRVGRSVESLPDGGRRFSPRRLIGPLLRGLTILILVAHTLLLWLAKPLDFLTPGDFAGFWAPTVALVAGLNPYDRAVVDAVASQQMLPSHNWPFIYPPIFLLLLLPLASLPFPVAAAWWLAINALSCVASLVLLASMLPRGALRGFGVLVITISFLAYLPVLLNLILGNINPIILLLVVVSLRFARRMAVAAGLALGVAIAIKITPAVFLALFFLANRRWRLLTAASMCALGLTVVGAVVGGPALWSVFMTDAVPMYFSGDFAHSVTYPFNQTLGGFFSRLFSDGEQTTPWIVLPLAAKAGHGFVAVVLLVATAWIWLAARGRETEQMAAALALPLAVMLPAYSHVYYAVWLLPAYGLVLGWLLDQHSSSRSVVAGIVLAFSFALTGFIYDYTAEPLRSGPLLPLSSLPLAGVMLLWVLLAVIVKAAFTPPIASSVPDPR